jgi:3'(2'), 5'-bisphosphate nucleotidase
MEPALMMSDDDRLARDLATEAGRRLLALRSAGGDPDMLRKAGDRRSHEFLAGELARLRPDDAVLSEEGRDDPARLSASRVWIVDPLDGTREFGDAGRTDWAVHVALWELGELTAGAVALPAQGKTLSTAEPPAAVAGPLAGPAGSQRAAQAAEGGATALPRNLRFVVSRTRPPAFVQSLADQAGAVLLPLGSAGAKAAMVICGDADAYIHSGGQYEWDSAAPVAVARAAGLHASRIDGAKLSYNQEHPWMPDILICLAPLAGPLLEAIAVAGGAGE